MKPLPIASPCELPWSAMRPVEGGRHCGACDRRVVDLSRMTEIEVLTLIRTTTSCCVRQQVAPDGELILAAPPRPSRPPRPSAVLALAALVASGAAQAEAPPPGETATEDGAKPAAPVQIARKTEVDFTDLDVGVDPFTFMGVYVSIDKNVPLPSVDFDPGSARIPQPALATVSYIAAVVAQDLGAKQILLLARAAPDERPKLARRRAEAVADALVSMGVPRERITIQLEEGTGPFPWPLRVDITLCDDTCENAPTRLP